MKQKKKPRSFRLLRNLFAIALLIAVWGLVRSQTLYFSAPFDSPSHRAIRLISTANMQNSGLLQSYDARYSLEFILHISVEPAPSLPPNQSETICLSPVATVQPLSSSPTRRYVPLEWADQLEEEVMRRGDIKIDHHNLVAVEPSIVTILIPIFPSSLGTWGACTSSCEFRNCFNVSNLPVGLHTITLNTHSDITGHSYLPSWQILIEE